MTLARFSAATVAITLRRLRRVAPALIVMLAIAGCSPQAALPERFYVSNERGNSISVIDPATAAIVRTMPVGMRPRGLRVSPDGATLYVAVSGSPIGGPGKAASALPPADHKADGIAVLDLRSGKVERVLNGGTDPESFAMAPDGKILYVSNEDKGAVSAVSTDGSRTTLTAPVGEEPEGVAVTADGRRLFVACEASDYVAILDARSLAPIRRIPLSGRPRSALISRNGQIVFIAVESAGKIALLSAQDGALIGLIDVAGGDPAVKPMGMVEGADGHLFVSTGRAGSVLELDPARQAIVRRIGQVGARPWGIGLSADGRILATANGPSDDVSLIPIGGGARRAVRTGGGPWGIAGPPRAR